MKAIRPKDAGWNAYSEARLPEAREQMLLQYLPLVRRVAGRLLTSLPKSVRLDDLVSAGVVGLLSSLDHFDPQHGVKFETFAVNRIRGAMVDSLREMDWVPRSIRHKARQLEKAIEELAQQLGRIPQDVEIAQFMSLPLEDLNRTLDEVNVAVLLSLDDAFPGRRGDGMTLADTAHDPASSTHDQLEDVELRELLVRFLKVLPEQEKLVLALYYYEELNFKEIGEVLGLTESRVSQIHSKAILKLRAAVKSGMNR